MVSNLKGSESFFIKYAIIQVEEDENERSISFCINVTHF